MARVTPAEYEEVQRQRTRAQEERDSYRSQLHDANLEIAGLRRCLETTFDLKAQVIEIPMRPWQLRLRIVELLLDNGDKLKANNVLDSAKELYEWVKPQGSPPPEDRQ